MWILWDIMISGNLTRLGGIELETCKLGCLQLGNY